MTRDEEIKKAAKEIAQGIEDWELAAYIEDAFIEGAWWADAHPHWISVDDELPKIGKDVLVLREDGEMQVAHQYNEEIARWWSVDGFPLKNNITHWMLLPQAPKKGGEE